MRTSTKILAGAVAVAGLVLVYAVTGIWPPVDRAGPPLQLIVHAGDMSVGPENSLEAIIGAIKTGASFVRKRPSPWSKR